MTQEHDDARRRLAIALTPDPSYTHDQALASLPVYVTDELLGRPVGSLYPRLHHHLLHCSTCAAEHVTLLADFTVEPESVPVPPPQLDFLPPVRQAPYLDRLRRFAEQATETILTALRPASLGELALVAEIFFDQVGDRLDQIAIQPAPQTAFNFAASAPPALRFLAATTITTHRLATELSPQQVNTLSADNRLETVVHQAALGVASDLNLGRDALHFADEYTRWLLRQVDELPRPS